MGVFGGSYPLYSASIIAFYNNEIDTAYSSLYFLVPPLCLILI